MCLLGQFYYEGNADVIKFFRVAHEHGLWVSLRVGPYIAAEWNQGYMSTYIDACMHAFKLCSLISCIIIYYSSSTAQRISILAERSSRHQLPKL